MIETVQIQAAFQALRAGRRAMRATTAEQRIELLENLRAEIQRRKTDIIEAIHQDLGRPLTDEGEFATIMGNIDMVHAHLKEWMEPVTVEKSPTSPEAEAIYIKYEPRGVVLLFGTWDFPFGMFFSPLIQAVAAGNTVLGKTSSMAPASGTVAAEIVRAVFGPDQVAVFEADDVETTADGRSLNNVLLDLPVDHIFLTGSPKVGKEIVKAASRHLATFTLELGGKSPAILDETADLDLAAGAFVGGKAGYQGQTCLSVDYVWVPEGLRDTFIEKYAAALQRAYYVDGEYQLDRDQRIVNRRNYDRVKGYLTEAVERGAKVAFGGSTWDDELTIEPTVLLDTPLDTDVVQEEIFGPILPVMTYTDVEEIFAHSDSLGKPLGFYIYSEDQQFIDHILDNTTSGGVTVNGHVVHWLEENLPFGGVNSSGYGRYHGVWGFRELSNTRSVFHVKTT
ncbi:aldehyde dehydrogenase family protein [Streptomyces sp. NPDC026672]|uniref:aldehyde dehydrogenase family protein n=1 Tax=unclassified Streptomyces TaxID=2593676 RepID=UPI0033FC96DC